VAEISSGKPYTQLNDIRTFSENVDELDLVWHRDKYNREITILEGENWFLQLDNQLPVALQKGKTYTIPAMEYHRIIKGDSNLVIKIREER
jgi:hypothetical protein